MINLGIIINMQLIYRSFARFSLDFSKLAPPVTKTGIRNYHITATRPVDGYATANFTSKAPLHTVIMIHEWWGLNQSITKTAEIFSNQNIRVFVPDLYRD
jgi:hypothetical protein